MLLNKVSKFTFQRSYRLFKSDFSNRLQVVRMSKIAFLLVSGVPQDNILWPLLFLIFISHLPSVLKNSSYLLFADEKCFVKTFTSKFNYPKYDYFLNNKLLERKTDCMDLGIPMQTKFKFNNHYLLISTKVFRTFCFIIRNSKHF